MRIRRRNLFLTSNYCAHSDGRISSLCPSVRNKHISYWLDGSWDGAQLAKTKLQQSHDVIDFMVSAKPKRPSPISLRLSEEEKTELNKRATGMPINAYIKSCLFRGSACKPKISGSALVRDRKALSQAIGLLGQSEIARNLSQIS